MVFKSENIIIGMNAKQHYYKSTNHSVYLQHCNLWPISLVKTTTSTLNKYFVNNQINVSVVGERDRELSSLSSNVLYISVWLTFDLQTYDIFMYIFFTEEVIFFSGHVYIPYEMR